MVLFPLCPRGDLGTSSSCELEQRRTSARDEPDCLRVSYCISATLKQGPLSGSLVRGRRWTSQAVCRPRGPEGQSERQDRAWRRVLAPLLVAERSGGTAWPPGMRPHCQRPCCPDHPGLSAEPPPGREPCRLWGTPRGAERHPAGAEGTGCTAGSGLLLPPGWETVILGPLLSFLIGVAFQRNGSRTKKWSTWTLMLVCVSLGSGPRDHVFVYFTDHGATGILVFPNDDVSSS